MSHIDDLNLDRRENLEGLIKLDELNKKMNIARGEAEVPACEILKKAQAEFDEFVKAHPIETPSSVKLGQAKEALAKIDKALAERQEEIEMMEDQINRQGFMSKVTSSAVSKLYPVKKKEYDDTLRFRQTTKLPRQIMALEARVKREFKEGWDALAEERAPFDKALADAKELVATQREEARAALGENPEQIHAQIAQLMGEIYPGFDLDAMMDVKNLEVRDFVEFGRYPYEVDGEPESIEWEILEVQKDRVLMATADVIEQRAYHDDYVEVSWEDCELRAWLNGEFMNTAFNGAERALILEATHDIKYLKKDIVESTSTDKVFALSYDEVNDYYDPKKLYEAVGISPYAQAKEVFDSIGEQGFPWWIRGPKNSKGTSATVDDDALYITSHWRVISDSVGVRPVLWLKLLGVEEPKEEYEEMLADSFEDIDVDDLELEAVEKLVAKDEK